MYLGTLDNDMHSLITEFFNGPPELYLDKFPVKQHYRQQKERIW